LFPQGTCGGEDLAGQGGSWQSGAKLRAGAGPVPGGNGNHEAAAPSPRGPPVRSVRGACALLSGPGKRKSKRFG